MLRTTDSPGQETRYDAETVRKVTALAQQLQDRQQETLTARQIEEIGGEVGLAPGFIRQALARLRQTPADELERQRRAEFKELLAAWLFTAFWGAAAWFLRFDTGWVNGFTTVVAPAPLALLLGFLTGKDRAGACAGLALMATLAPTFHHEYLRMSHEFNGLGYVVFGGPVAAILGWQGARLRSHFFPRKDAPRTPLGRAELLDLLFSLQSQLEGQRQRRAFLSVDVVGSTAMKQDATDLAAEHSFNRYREWVEGIVSGEGGEVQSAAGDGLMAMFPDEARALRAARQLQDGLDRFNTESNRLPRPFRLRCGVSAGEVPLEPGRPLGHLQSAVIDRAAVLQKSARPGEVVVGGEAVAAALLELGAVTPAPGATPESPAFVWHRSA
ncbi:MAG: adenylate/guanylate cyclase domain-containing protein [Armatimonadota bacterium]